MDKKVSELLETIDLNDEDILMILQSGQNKKIKAMNAFKRINESLSNLDNTKAEKTEVSTLNTKVTNLENTKANKTDLISQELDVSSLLQNNWQEYYLCQIFKVNNVVHVQICAKSGTETTVATLPEGYRPKELLFFPMTVVTGDGIATDPYGSLSTAGELQCPQQNVGKLIFINFSFLVE